ncbi:CCA tRNA nucleotidyltransferase [Halobacillus seohaensis]|uniref:CCA-adding enzyme n=1 Tax=Halobacillus seohaensis TaxID=447421 RepID=A0ABW2EHR5_9BACI
MNPKINKALEIIKIIEEAGGSAHVVGGAVRDTFLKRQTKDIDLATSFKPDQVMKLFNKVIPLGIEHGTVLVRYKSESYEITTYRTEEGYEDYRHPDQVQFVRSINEDLARRDFTINAMALNSRQKVIDPYKGMEDLNHQVLRAVGHPEERFKEDPLRMMRALRFASELQFTLEQNTYSAIQKQAHLLKQISVERIAVEFEKLCTGRDYNRVLPLCFTIGISNNIPIFQDEPQLIKILPQSRLTSFAEIVAFYCEKGSIYKEDDWIKKWKQSNKVKRESIMLLKAVRRFRENDRELNWILYNLSGSLIVKFSNVMNALNYKVNQQSLEKTYEQLPIQSRKKLAFQANDLLLVFHDQRKGAWIGRSIKRIERAVVLGEIPNEYQAIKEWVKTWKPPEIV